MTKKLLHTNSRIFFKDSYVYRVNLPGFTHDQATIKVRDLTKKSYELLKGTWGYSSIMTTFDTKSNTNTYSFGPGAMIQFQSPEPNNHVYFCFVDEADALQFFLYIEYKYVRVYMWPSQLKFTIHEYVEDNE